MEMGFSPSPEKFIVYRYGGYVKEQGPDVAAREC